MSAVVGAWGDFVDEQLRVGDSEEFDAEDAEDVKVFKDCLRDLAGLFSECGSDERGRANGDVEDMIDVSVHGGCEEVAGVVGESCADEGHFEGEFDAFFEDCLRNAEGFPGVVQVVPAANADLSFAVISHGDSFEDAITADGFESGSQFGGGGDSMKICGWDADGLNGGFLQQSILGCLKQLGAGEDGDEIFEELNSFERDVFLLVGDDGHHLSELGKLIKVGKFVGAAVVTDLATGGIVGVTEGDDVKAERASGEREHASELSSTEHPKCGAWQEGLGFSGHIRST